MKIISYHLYIPQQSLDLLLICKNNIQSIWSRFKIHEIQLSLSLGYIA